MNARDRVRALVADRAERPWYEIRAAADTDETLVVYIYDEIDSWFGVSAEAFARDLAALDAERIEVHINSPGGNAYDGLAIMNAIAGHPAQITTIVDGLAASAASYIAIAGDEVIMRPGAQMMIHEAWGLAVGDARDMAAMAEQLDGASSALAEIYAKKTGGDADAMRELMRAETWFSADEAVEAGLADRVEAPSKSKAGGGGAAKARAFDLSVFNFAGRRAAPAPRLHRSPSARVRAEVTPGERRAAVPTLIEGLREQLGLPEDADEATVLAAVTAKLDSGGAATTEPGPADEPAEPTLQQIAASAKRLNLRLVDAEQYEQLSAQAAQGAQAFARQQEQHRNHVLSEAIRTGRISKGQRESYAKQLERDPEGTEAFLNSLPRNVAVSLEEIGHAGEPEVDELGADMAAAYAKVTGTNWKDA
ncbi:head maturation protease, ClpP-related [Nocardia sp. NPDC051911]|uniref:head maturation protease, ClpP-related n=1 Tax=Nocardia sp. NPDC051911 TaxID=3154648 RepID=UPI0034137324